MPSQVTCVCTEHDDGLGSKTYKVTVTFDYMAPSPGQEVLYVSLAEPEVEFQPTSISAAKLTPKTPPTTGFNQTFWIQNHDCFSTQPTSCKVRYREISPAFELSSNGCPCSTSTSVVKSAKISGKVKKKK